MSKIKYMTSDDKPDSPSIAQIMRYIAPVSMQIRCLELLDHFFQNPLLLSAPVVDAEAMPIALIERRSFVEYFGKPFARELHERKSILEFLTAAPIACEAPIVIAASTSIDDVAAIVSGRDMQHMVSGFIITANGRYAGVANGHDLLNDITQRKQAELYFLAHFDQLTKLPNRMLFADRLNQACLEASRMGAMVGLMFIDLDRFKQVNDSLGHAVGDLLLKDAARRLRACAREYDTVARLGGDEFAVLLDKLDDAADADLVARRIIEVMRQPFYLVEHELFITASIGMAMFPHDDQDIGNLLAKADAAMYESKRNGRDGYLRYVPGVSMYSLDKFSLETDLRTALEDGEFILHYQPQVCLKTGVAIGVEALIRWQHPRRGLLSPGHFIEIAEESGLIVPIGEWALREACLQIRAWEEADLPALCMSVNVSALQFRQERFCRTVSSAIEAAGINPALLQLELTESMVMQRAPSVQGILERLCQIGVKLAIDDFGTGFSSLSYLRHFPIDRLKIDQSFVRGIDHTPANESIVRAITALAKSLSLELVAEGIETSTELAVVRDCGCHLAQGYLFLRPVEASGLAGWLEENSRRERHQRRLTARGKEA
jgi:diguanylate cyclase (GGDEF)-like protein